MFKYNKEQLLELKKAADLIGGDYDALSDTLLSQLVKRFWDNKNYLDNLPENHNPNKKTAEELLFELPYNGACACMGPQDGEMYCGCTMRNLLYRYRYDVALEVIKQQSSTNTLLKDIKNALSQPYDDTETDKLCTHIIQLIIAMTRMRTFRNGINSPQNKTLELIRNDILNFFSDVQEKDVNEIYNESELFRDYFKIKI